jgi:1-acyl-sn-glycerol-3-phosphate acyltransferase
VAIDYGRANHIFAWPNGESGKDNALRILGRRGSTPVVVRLLDPLPPSPDRKAIARAAHDAIAVALAASNAARPNL